MRTRDAVDGTRHNVQCVQGKLRVEAAFESQTEGRRTVGNGKPG